MMQGEVLAPFIVMIVTHRSLMDSAIPILLAICDFLKLNANVDSADFRRPGLVALLNKTANSLHPNRAARAEARPFSGHIARAWSVEPSLGYPWLFHVYPIGLDIAQERHHLRVFFIPSETRKRIDGHETMSLPFVIEIELLRGRSHRGSDAFQREEQLSRIKASPNTERGFSMKKETKFETCDGARATLTPPFHWIP
jgi:hypothetical protein